MHCFIILSSYINITETTEYIVSNLQTDWSESDDIEIAEQIPYKVLYYFTIKVN